MRTAHERVPPHMPPLSHTLRAEARLLLCCAGGPDVDHAVGELARGPVDWDRFAVLVQREHAAPVVWRRLAACAPGAVPADAAAALDRLARVTEFRMRYLEQRLAESTAALADTRVPCVLLKGAAMATAVYGSFVERPMIDLDLLVPPDRAADALHALGTAGWAPERGKDWRNVRSHHLPALHDRRGMHVSLELHTEPLALGHPFGLTAAALFDAAAPAPRAGGQALVPAPEHLLVHACVHFVWQHLARMHAWRAIRDVRAVAERELVDWDRFVAAAVAMQAGTCCYWTLRLARDLAGPVAPAPVLDALRPPLPEAVLRAVARHLALVLFPSDVGCPSVLVRRAVWSLGVLPRWSGHGAARPWHTLTMTEEARERRGVRAAEVQAARRPARERAAGWAAYGRRVLLGG